MSMHQENLSTDSPGNNGRFPSWRSKVLISLLFICPIIILLAWQINKAPSIKESIQSTFSVKVTQPNVKLFTDITSKITITATGKFTGGTFFLGKALVTIPVDTDFRLNLAVPIDNPSEISTRNVSGFLQTSKPLSINTVPVPEKLLLEQGKISGEFEFARTIGAFFFNLLFVVPDNSNLQKMIHAINVEEAKLILRPGSQLKIGPKTIQIADGSTVTLKNAQVDTNLNYRSHLIVTANFAKDCRWIGEKVDCEFNGGHATIALQLTKTDNALTLIPDQSSKVKQSLFLQDCIFRFGKWKRSFSRSKNCHITIQELQWQNIRKTSHPTLHFLGLLDFSDSLLHLKTDIHQTIAHFSHTVKGRLETDITLKDRSTSFSTLEPATAVEGRVIVNKNDTSLVLHLADATIGPVVYDKSGGLQFTLQSSTAKLKQVDWSSGNSHFAMITAGPAYLQLPKQMLLHKSDSKSPTCVNLPLALQASTAIFKSKHGSFTLTDLKGNVNINTDQGLKVTGDLDFLLKDFRLLASKNVDVIVQGINLSTQKNVTALNLRRCTVIVPKESLEEALTKQIPHTFTIDINKTVVEDKKWRYRNAFVKTASVNDLKIDSMSASPPDNLNFQASAAVILVGTVEKGKLTAVISKTTKWITCPWKLTGDITADGAIKYKFLDDSSVAYDLSMSLPIPSDVKLDWSQVSGGLIKIAERQVILSHLRKITVPIHHAGQITLFDGNNTLLSEIVISNLIVSSADSGTKLTFAAHLEL